MADDLYEYIEHDSLMFYTKDVLSLTFSKKFMFKWRTSTRYILPNPVGIRFRLIK